MGPRHPLHGLRRPRLLGVAYGCHMHRDPGREQRYQCEGRFVQPITGNHQTTEYVRMLSTLFKIEFKGIRRS